MANPIKENNFEGGSGMTGTQNYSTGYGTFSSPNVSQNPSSFENNNNNKAINQNSNTTKGGTINTGSIGDDLSAIYAKKDTPTPDEVVTGIKYELGQMTKKDKMKAKQIVAQHLREDPHYYGSLKMMNIDDKSMVDSMKENKHPNDAPARNKITNKTEETKKIFSELINGRDNKYVVNSGICDVMKQMWAQKEQRNSWRNGG
jgi:hypothetical protein